MIPQRFCFLTIIAKVISWIALIVSNTFELNISMKILRWTKSPGDMLTPKLLIGNSTLTIVCGGVLMTSIVPEWLTTILCAIDSPRPTPFPGSFVVKNGLKTLSSIFRGIPPQSSTKLILTFSSLTSNKTCI